MHCPFCSSANTKTTGLPDLGDTVEVCMECASFYEPETRKDPLRQMCDNCAFRPGSNERADPWHWLHIIEATIVEGRHPFHCHKNLKCELTETGYRFLQPDTGMEGLTPCAGWYSRLMAYRAGVPAHKL